MPHTSDNSSASPRALSFGAVAADYDRYRPAAPQAAIDWLLPLRVGSALDLGAGTGALSRLLLDKADVVIAVEPDPRMRALIARGLPQVRLLEGRAESLPLPHDSVDAVLVSSAWHWMDPALAVPEIARVLRDGGVFGILWNGLDHDAPLGAAMRRELHDALPDPAGAQHRPEHIVLPADAPFGAPEIHTVKWRWQTSRQNLLGLMGTFSSVIRLPARDRQALLDRVADLIAAQPEFADPQHIAVPAACRCWRALRRSGGGSHGGGGPSGGGGSGPSGSGSGSGSGSA